LYVYYSTVGPTDYSTQTEIRRTKWMLAARTSCCVLRWTGRTLRWTRC